MNTAPFSFFQLPHQTLVQSRLTKAFFKRNFELLPSERKLLEDAMLVKEMEIYATLKPSNCNVPAFVCSTENYEEIVFLLVKTANEDFEKNAKKIGDFIQKHIPYHLVIGMYAENNFLLHLAFKNINQKDQNKRTILQIKQSKVFSINAQENQAELLEALSFKNLDKTNLKTLYTSYTTAIDNWTVAAMTGSFIPRPYERSVEAVMVMEEIENYQKEISNLQSQIKETTQMNLRIELNTTVHHLKNKIDSLKKSLSE
ncbi:MAG TPA: DUF4391 domain-containing protein [Edaphocola sp.]|nr:DUF4391 domain-containing protein [Edaphocola sp.]